LFDSCEIEVEEWTGLEGFEEASLCDVTLVVKSVDTVVGGADTVVGGVDTVVGSVDTVVGGVDTVVGGVDTVTVEEDVNAVAIAVKTRFGVSVMRLHREG